MITKNFLSILILINFLSFVFGFIFLEEHGASILDANQHTYPAINGLKENFFKNISIYGNYGENSYPLHHIIFGYLIPFNVGTVYFKLSSCLISFIYLYFFYLIIKKKFKFQKIELIFLTSLLILSPYFRSSAYWGLTENTGLGFAIISIYFFIICQNNNLFKFSHLFLICVFSSLALYARLEFVFLCMFFYISFLNNLKIKKIIFTSSIYLIMTIPGLVLIFIWGGVLDEQWSGEFNYLINISTIPRTLLVIFSLIGFYSIPFLLILNSKNKFLKKKNIINFSYSLLICVLVFNLLNIDIFELDPSQNYPYGQGFVTNIAFRFTGIESGYLFFSAIGLLISYYVFLISIQNKILIFCLLSVFSLRVHFFTEYLDPLIFILIFSLLNLGNSKINLNRKNILILQSFFMALLTGAILI